MHLYCVFLDQKVKKSDFYFEPGRGFPKIWQPLHNMQWLKKERMKACVFLSFFLLFVFWLEPKAYGDATHVL